MDDKQKIEQGVQLYFDSMYESSAEKVHQAFYENAMITGYMETGLAEMTVDQFADFVAGYGSRKKRPLRPDFRDALETQYICEAVLDSAKTGRWKKVGKIRSKAK